MDEHRLDGNAVAGILLEVFSFDVTNAEYACGKCGRPGRIGETLVYDVDGMGTIVRCPGCDNAVFRISRIRERTFIDSKGMEHLIID